LNNDINWLDSWYLQCLTCGQKLSKTLGPAADLDVADELKALATGAASPMMQSAVAAMKPAIMEALQEYTPTFAAVSGGMLALSVLLGIWVAKKTFEGWRW
jgi:hypothetical protein